MPNILAKNVNGIEVTLIRQFKVANTGDVDGSEIRRSPPGMVLKPCK